MKTKPRILVCDPIDDEGILRLRTAGFTVDVNPTITPDQLRKSIPDYEVLIVRGRTKVDKQVLELGKKLKVVGRAGSGLDNIDVDTAQEKGLEVLNTPEAAGEAVAELTIGLMLCLARNIPYADKALKEGKWIKKELMGWEAHGKVLGIIGLGNIGEKVARLAKGFGMKILIHKRTPPDPSVLEELQAEFVPLNELLSRSNIVTIHIPYTSKTYHMIGKKELLLMKKNAYIVNTSRGSIVDEQALLETLRSGRLAGAALDVFEAEPPVDWTMMKLPNVVCTPHIGSQTEEAQKKASILLARKITDSFS